MLQQKNTVKQDEAVILVLIDFPKPCSPFIRPEEFTIIPAYYQIVCNSSFTRMEKLLIKVHRGCVIHSKHLSEILHF